MKITQNKDNKRPHFYKSRKAIRSNMALQIHTVLLLPFPSPFLSHLVILVIPVHSFQRSLTLVVQLV